MGPAKHIALALACAGIGLLIGISFAEALLHDRHNGAVAAASPRSDNEAKNIPHQFTSDETTLLKTLLRCRKDILLRKAKRAQAIDARLQEVLRLTEEVLVSDEVDDMTKAQSAAGAVEVLVAFGRYEKAVEFAIEVTERDLESHGIYYFRAVAMLNLNRPWNPLIEADLRRSLELATNPPKEVVRLHPSLWDIYLALAKFHYETAEYAEMCAAYQAFVYATDPLSGSRNLLALDWDGLSATAKIRRMMRDLNLERGDLKQPLEIVFASLVEDQTKRSGD